MTTVIAALAGLLMGHVLDIAFDRLYTDAPLGGPAYRCPHCRARLRPLYLLPILGPLWSRPDGRPSVSGGDSPGRGRGRCADCGRPLPLHAFLLAPGAAALFATSQLVFDGLGPALLAGFFATIFLTLAFTDLERRLLPNRVVYPSIVLAAAVSWAWPEVSVLQVFGGGAAALVITSVLYVAGRGAFGFGDVKLSVLMGLVVGFPSVLVGMFMGAIAAGVFVLPLVLLRVLDRRDYIAYGPFIAAGAVIALFWGDAIWDWYFQG
ncbi:MAG: A24 family peptidase [Dehalococcoidia bacterium]|nr:A24 family peptidase [Dehalococcoidia bacterium]